jgi:uncharacterized protein YoxC
MQVALAMFTPTRSNVTRRVSRLIEDVPREDGRLSSVFDSVEHVDSVQNLQHTAMDPSEAQLINLHSLG